MEQMTFAAALAAMLAGSKVARVGWKGVNQHVCQCTELETPWWEIVNAENAADPENEVEPYEPTEQDVAEAKMKRFIYTNEEGTVLPDWLPSHIDLQCDDWVVWTEPAPEEPAPAE